MVDSPEPSKERIPLLELQKEGRSDWIDYVAPVAFMFFGALLACCCGGSSMIGDYIGPPEGLAESNRQRLLYGVLASIPGLAVVALGIWLLLKCLRKRYFS